MTFYLWLILISFAVYCFLLPFFRKISLKYGILLKDKVSLVGGPLLAVIFITVGFFALLASAGVSPQILGIFGASLIMLVFGILDDCRELSVAGKFLLQIVACSALIIFGVRTRIVGLGEPLNILVTLLWTLGITNAFNHLDVMDGVAGVSAAVIASAFFVISLVNGNIPVAILSACLFAVISGFLVFNFPPARVYLGNAGSHFLGFVFASLAMLISYAPLERKIALLTPILILGFPVYDTLFLILARLVRNKVPFRKSNDHLVLRLMFLGWGKRKIALVILFWNFIFFCFALIVGYSSNLLGAAAVCFIVLASLITTKQIGKIAVND